MIGWPVLLAGAAVGAGLALVVAGLLPTTPDLRSVLAHLDTRPATVAPQATSPGEGIAGRCRSWAAARLGPLAARLGLERYRADLDLLGETAGRLAARKIGYGLLGLAFPPLLTGVLALIGTALPITVPALGSVVLAGVLFVVPDLDVRRRGATARLELRRTVCVYLELVALERAADAGTVEALNRAAAIGDGRAFALIRDALLRAHLAGAPPWQALARLAKDVGVPELADVADIMRLSGEDGAAVYATLRARAASLRTSLLTAAAAEANAASEHMIMPVAFLGIAFMALVGYPAFARILFG